MTTVPASGELSDGDDRFGWKSVKDALDGALAQSRSERGSRSLSGIYEAMVVLDGTGHAITFKSVAEQCKVAGGGPVAQSIQNSRPSADLVRAGQAAQATRLRPRPSKPFKEEVLARFPELDLRSRVATVFAQLLLCHAWASPGAHRSHDCHRVTGGHRHRLAREQLLFAHRPLLHRGSATCLMRLRQFGESLAQQLAAHAGVFLGVDEAQSDLLGRVKRDTAYPRDVIDLFHDPRRAGKEAVHQHRGDYATALAGLKVARQRAVWSIAPSATGALGRARLSRRGRRPTL